MASGKFSDSLPKGNATTSGTQARPGTLDVYCVTPDGVKVYIGWALDKKKLAYFSIAADRHINLDSYTRKDKKDEPRYPPKKPAPSSELLLPNADRDAAAIILNWINANDIASPKPLKWGSEVLSNEEFHVALDIHHADHAFDLKREHRGQEVRNKIFKWISDRDGKKRLSLDDFKACMEKCQFDGTIAKNVMNKVMWLSITSKIPKGTLSAIKNYCRQTGRYESMKILSEGIMEKRKDKGTARKGGEESTGW